MTTKRKKKETKNVNKSGAEKPVSLWGASLTEVLKALLKTKPMVKNGKEKKIKTKTNAGE
jgi:hypothetical protein